MAQTNRKEEIKQRLETMQKNPLEVTRESVDALWGPAREAWKNYVEALDTYERDLQTRQQTLDKQGTELDQQINELSEFLAALQRTSRSLASKGHIDEATRLADEAENVGKRLATIRRKRAIIESTELRGDSVLYSAIQARQADYVSARSTSEQAIREALDLVNGWIKRFEALAREARIVPYCGPGDRATDKRLDAIMSRHLLTN